MFVRICAAAILSSISAGAAWSQDQATASVGFVDAEGMENGTAEISAIASGGVLVRMEVKGLPAGEWVAVHFHETGTCDHTTKHESAGGHFNPGSKEHGFNAASGPHAGDMPNQYVGSDGTVRAEIFNSMATLDDGESSVKGRALMVHAKADDYKSQPSGNAGDRLACGAIQ